METCPECGESFEYDPLYRKQKYCSKRCKTRALVHRHHVRCDSGAYGSCSVEGCDRPVSHIALQLCRLHIARLRTHGDVGPAGSMRRGPRPCKVRECTNQAVTSDDLCPTHSRRKQLYGNADGTLSTTTACSVDGCSEFVSPARHSSKFCKAHYVEFVYDEVAAGRITGHKGSNGYVTISVMRRKRAVHQIVMERMLGRTLRPFENVHHINGVRDDNRPENLELWTKPQTCGQRVSDLVAWVVEKYPDEVRANLQH